MQQRANSAHVLGKNKNETKERRKAFSLYGMWAAWQLDGSKGIESKWKS